MRLSTIAERIPLWYANRISFHLSGPPGIGKTSIVHAAVEKIRKKTPNFGLIVVNGACLTLPDIIGYGLPNKFTGSDGAEHIEMVFSRPFFSRTTDDRRWDEYEGGLLFVDEYDKAELDSKKVLGESKLSGRLGPHLLAHNWLVVTAGNRAIDRAGSTKFFDHDINRTMWVDVQLPFGDWEGWALANGVMPVTIAYAKQNPTIVFPETVPEKQGAWCTARSLTRMDSYFRSIIADLGHLPDDGVVLEEAAGLTGAANANHYFAFLRTGAKLPTTDQILADPAGCEVPTSPDGQMIVCYNLARDTNTNNVTAITTYVNRCDAEFANTYYRSAVKSNHRLVLNKNFAQWAQYNSHLQALLYPSSF